MFSGVTFPIAIGDAFNPSKIIQEDEVEMTVEGGVSPVGAPVDEDAFEKQMSHSHSWYDVSVSQTQGSASSIT